MKNRFSSIALLVGSLLCCSCAVKPKKSMYVDYQTKTDLTFSLTGESLIGTGGRTLVQNPDHIYTRDQIFAIDIVALAPGSYPRELENLVDRALSGTLPVFRGGEGDDYKLNEKHYCYGRLIVSPGSGVVVDSKDGVPDGVPGRRNDWARAGNYVVVDHLNGEYSMLAHFQTGSVLVNKGDSVEAGDPLGKCGNSGRSNLPHLHYHLQNPPFWFAGDALPAQFSHYYSNGEYVRRGEPVQGEIISQK